MSAWASRTGRASSRLAPRRASSCARRSGLRRLRAGAKGSRTRPPPRVRWADWSRRTRRSPCTAWAGAFSTSWAKPRWPGASCSSSSRATRPVTSCAARCRWTGVQCARARCSPGSRRRSMSMRVVGACSCGASSQSPRWMSSTPRRSPAMFSATRWPAWALSAARFCACRPRTRTRRPALPSSSSSPIRTRPENAVPVTTTPLPLTLKARSMGRRKPPSPDFSRVSRAASDRAARKASMPSPLMLETGWIGAPASGPGASSASTSARASASRCGVTRSILLSATSARGMPSSSTMARCSRVCGITPSSAATTSSTRSMPQAPASMLWTKRSWPGTSMKPVSAPSPRSA
ncbi:hypothetical protein D9M69_403410 [compost metagenome]